MRRILISLLLVCFWIPLFSQNITFSGRILEKGSRVPVEFATVVLPERELWAVADAEGNFIIKNVPHGKSRVEVACLGYVTLSREIVFKADEKPLEFILEKDNLTLEDVVITAKDDSNSATTTRTIDKAALEQVQMMNVSDIASLLPGGATPNSALLTSEQSIILRGASSEAGNPAFGTAIEVDGVRISNNASFQTTSSSSPVKGVSTNNIASTNVESVEVITGVPSVEYGDMSSGVVKVNLKKGKTPWMVTMSTSPNTKQTSVSKGFGLGSGKGGQRGVINASAEYTESVSKQMSPYTAYRREQLSLSYMRTVNSGLFASTPLRINAGITGNLGGMNTSADPDAVQGTWSKARDNAVRTNFSLSWLLGKPWITNLELSGSLSYSDKGSRERTYNSSAINKIVLHGKEQGYFMAVPYSAGTVPAVMYIPGGYWYNVMEEDDRPLATRLSIKANQSHHYGNINNKVKLGADWSTDKNFGIGNFSSEMETAPTFREYRYCEVPTMHNLGAYLEDNLMLPLGTGHLNLIAGLRSDNTLIKGSAYGLTSSISPRFNAKYVILPREGRGGKTVRELALRAGWGEAVKLPSFSILFPKPTYRDLRVFTSPTNSANESMEAYYIQPRTIEYNPDLKWQRNRMLEMAVETDILGNKISLTGYWTQTLNTYRISTRYERTTYTYTPDANVASVAIPADDRAYSIDPSTGIVTVSDKTGKLPSEALSYLTYKELAPLYYADNEVNPINRYGLEWVVEFARIKAIRTDIRLDGSWYAYKSVPGNMIEYSPYTLRSSGDKLPYRYVGFYYGNNAYSNGSESRTLRTNLTVTTHIPSVRLILSAKVEASLLRYTRTLSETAEGEELAKVISDVSDILSVTGESIYAGDNYVVRYPEYYCSYDDPTPRNYLEDLKAAKAAGNMNLFNDLWQLSYKSNYLYMLGKDYYSPYFSANFSVTKEIGELASISFYANNFFVNRQQIWSTKTRTYLSVAGYIPKFYYGLTVRIKF